MSDSHEMLGRAEQFLAAAESEAEAGRLETCFAMARTAAELAGKVLLLRGTGSYPEGRHDIGGILAHQGLVPRGVDKAQLATFLSQFTRGAYGFSEPVHRKEANRACLMARALLQAAGGAPVS